MNFIINFIFLFFIFTSSKILFASNALNVVTTTTTLQSIVQMIGKDLVQVSSIAKGPQDPHFIEAKPSYTVKLRRAHLVISVGLDLEIGWLSNIIRGSRNPRIRKGEIGYLETGEWIDPIEVLEGKTDRSQGDLHPKGNPHFLLDPIRALAVAQTISKKLQTLNPKNKDQYIKNTNAFKKKIDEKTSLWRKRIEKTKIKTFISYHKTLNYFAQRFNLKLAGFIEPKPGIPPTAKHTLSLINTIKKEKSFCILVESFFDTHATQKIKKSVPIHVEKVAAEVEALKGVNDYFSLIESLVIAIENCSQKIQVKEEPSSI